jgi:RNA polymerase sigma-70 factor, ECF subfamily
MTEERTDQELIAAYLHGEEDAFAALVSRYLKHTYHFVFRLTGNVRDAEDITQETFLKVWKHLKRYRPGESFKTWLFTIARRTAIDWLRKKKPLVFSEFEREDGRNVLVDNLTDDALLPDEESFLRERKDEIALLLEKIPPTYKEVITMHYDDELTFSEIAEIIGSPVDTVKSRHRRALIMLRKLISSSDHE